MEISQEQSPAVRDRRPEALGNLRVLPDELICETLGLLPCRDVGRLSCVSSVMYILCNEEPLWMNLCLNNVKGPLQYKGSWKKTALSQEHLLDENEGLLCKPLHFDGFSSLFLYRRFYRCYTSLNGFSFDDGNVERKNSLSLDEFNNKYDAQKPVLLSGLADAWPARSTWTIDQLLLNYGETVFKISQRSARKIKMKFNDYISYAKIQHDEDPLYIFDEKFGEVAPGLLNDYSVPSVFPEDFFDILDDNQRPSFRWLIIGPERSGASWHVDPALTSAWNTLLCGQKRWALYPPGKVPIGVTVHVNEDDGDVNIETPSSLQWWLDFYPLLSDEDKPVECTQLPGETIYVPSGWWHCVLNLETTVAVTQNYVNSRNFQFVCLDMAPGYSHKGVCRAGLLALDEDSFEKSKKNISNCGNGPNYLDLTRKEKRVRISNSINDDGTTLKCRGTRIEEFCYDIKFLSLFLDKERDHYNSLWSSSSCLGQREMREWLYRLWACKPHMRELVWKGACLALNADRWLETVSVICAFHNLPYPMDSERLPVGTGSNPVFLIADYVVKVYVEGGLEASLYGLGTELEFYDMLSKVNSQLKDHIPDVLASGFVFLKNGSFEVESWDGRGVPKVIAGSTFNSKVCTEDRFPFGVWSKKLHDYRNVGLSACESVAADGSMKIWPYIITKRCRGTIFAQLRDILSSEDTLALASFLGEQLHNLHLLPCPPFYDVTTRDQMSDLKLAVTMSDVTDEIGIPTGWKIFIKTLNRKKKFISSQLTKWGDPIPSNLIGKVDEYLPDDFTDLLNMSKDEGLCKVSKACSWIHSDIMDDNIIMEPYSDDSHLIVLKADMVDNGNFSSHGGSSGGFTWRPSHIVDFGNMSIGDRLCDLIAIHLDVFRGNTRLFKHLLQSYKLPLLGTLSSHVTVDGGSKFGRLSYHAMCYCIMHEDNVLGAIFSLWSELRAAESWEEVEEKVWGELNNYKGSG